MDEHTYLTQEDIIFLGSLLQQSNSKNVITAYTNILIEARKNGVKDKAHKVLHNEDMSTGHSVSMSTFASAGNSLLSEGVISIDNIPQHQQDYFRLNNDQKQAAIFGMVAMKEGMFNLQQVNQILKKWSQDYEATQCNIGQFCIENRFIEAEKFATIFQKAGEIEEGLGRVQFRNNILQVGASVPKNFGRYEIEQEIARGGMGIVYKAYDPSFQRTVALKVLIRGEGSSQLDVARFEREARSVYKIQHENIIPVYDLGNENGMPYFAMKFVEGHGLDKQKVPIPYRKAIKMLVPVANALHSAHQADIIHRDIKPANIMLDNEGKTWLTDFGLAKDKQGVQELTQAGSFMGTPAYMAPEQIDHPESVDAKCDIYSLGVVFYLLITGKPPYEANTFPALLRKIAEGKAKPPHLVRKEVPEEISRICMRAIAKKKKDRYGSAQRFAKDLESAAGKSPVKSTSKSTSKSSSKTGRTSSSKITRTTATTSGKLSRTAATKGRKTKRRSTNTTPIIIGAAVVLLLIIIVILSSSGDNPIPRKTPRNDVEFVKDKDKDKNNNNKIDKNTNNNPDGDKGNHVVKIPEQNKLTVVEVNDKLKKISVFMKTKNYAQATIHVDQILKDFPSNPIANYEKSRLLTVKKRYSDALNYVDIALDVKKPSAKHLSGKANILNKLKRFQEAVDYYTKALKKRHCIHCIRERSKIYMMGLRDYKRAAEDFAVLMDDDPTDKMVFRNAAIALSQLGSPKQAIDYFSRHLVKHPNSANAYFERGWVYYGPRKDFDKAFSDFSQAVKYNPNHVEARIHVGKVYYAKKEYKKALKIALGMSKKITYFEAPNLVGDCYLALKNKKKAIEAWREAIQHLKYTPPQLQTSLRAEIEAKIKKAQ